MISALRLVSITSPSSVSDLPSSVRLDGALQSSRSRSSSCSLSYPWKFPISSNQKRGSGYSQYYTAHPSIQNFKYISRTKSQRCQLSFGVAFCALTGQSTVSFRDKEWFREKRDFGIRCRECRDHHHHPDDDPGERFDRSEKCSFKQNKKEGKSSFIEVPDASSLEQSCESDQEGGYSLRVSKELMGVFRYVEKVKRAKIKELAHTLRQVAAACLFFSCVRGIVNPLAEVYKTSPPNWSKLFLMFGACDSFAITYLALKASEPLVQLSALATENQCDMMAGIKKEEEHLLALAVELVKLFRRLRNITLLTAFAQFVQVMHALFQLRDPRFTCNISKIFTTWIECPWG